MKPAVKEILSSELLAAMLAETQRRQRRTTDLSTFTDQLKEMMRLNISLPVILEWLGKQGETTTLPSLRRYVRRVFGDDHYDQFIRRNGWLKTKPTTANAKKSDGLHHAQKSSWPVAPAFIAHAVPDAREQTSDAPVLQETTDLPRLRCKPLAKDVPPLKKRNDIPPEFYEFGDLEHPAIPGLLLTLDERQFGAKLEIENLADNSVRLEDPKEKRFRIIWQKPIPMTPTRSSDSFVKMDMSLFGKGT